MAVRAGVVWIVRGLDRFVADDAVEHANLPIETIAQGHPKSNIGLADCEVSAADRVDGLSVEHICIWSGPEVHAITRSPFRFIEGLFDSELDDVQVESVGLAGAAEFVIRQAAIAGTNVPLG